jgi:serine/threonine protein phosphatase PrpC
MSFITKLLRKTEPLQPLADATAPVDASAIAVKPAELLGPVVENQGSIEPPAEQVEHAAHLPVEAATDAATPAAIPAVNDDAWWEEEVAASAPAAQPAHEDPTDQPDQQAVIPPPITGPTQPLTLAEEHDTPVTSPFPTELDGTRPLTAADVPMLTALRSHRGLAVGTLRDVGRVRSNNQDSAFALITTLPRESSDIQMGLFIVADGMGGHHGGEIASRLAISTIAQYVLAQLVVPALADDTTEALQPMIVAAVQEANRAIWEHGQSIGSDMGTTCTVVLLLGRTLYIGHVGDSRAYLATPTGLRLITTDHSTVGRLIQLGQLDPSEAREHPLRSQLYRTVGQQRDVLVDFVYQQVGDATHLLMGSDGLWGMLDEAVLQDVLEHNLWPQDACHELIARANLAGGDDNITAIVVTLPTPL